MAKANSTATKSLSAVEENPYLAPGFSIGGLIHNLKGHPPEWMAGMIAGKEKSPSEDLRLKAIIHQAEHAKMQAIWAIDSISEVLAIALDTEECSNRQAQRVAHAISFICEIVEVMEGHEDTALYMLANPDDEMYRSIRTGL